MMKKLPLFFIWMVALPFAAVSQGTYSDRIYDDNIVNVLLYANGNQLADPVIKLGSDDKLTLSFDDLSNQQENYKYTLIHCNSDWQASRLETSDYLSGYFEGDINNYQFSFNTLTPYIHYRLVFPQAEIRPKLSGNYIIKV